jgi:hypothetical protein
MVRTNTSDKAFLNPGVDAHGLIKKIEKHRKKMKILDIEHERVFYLHTKTLRKKTYVVVCAKKTNQSDVRNKSRCSKQHRILSFFRTDQYTCLFSENFDVQLDICLCSFSKISQNLFTIFLDFLFN